MQPSPSGPEASRRVIGVVSTVAFSIIMTGSALLFLSGTPKVVLSLAALGYPGYLAKLLGAAKLMGVAALWLPVPKTLREWAYAGFVFNLAGAVVSHLASPGPRAHALQHKITRHLKHKVAGEKHPRTEAVDLVAQAKLRLHLKSGEAYVDPIQVRDYIQHEQEGHEPPGEGPNDLGLALRSVWANLGDRFLLRRT